MYIMAPKSISVHKKMPNITFAQRIILVISISQDRFLDPAAVHLIDAPSLEDRVHVHVHIIDVPSLDVNKSFIFFLYIFNL